MSRDSCLTARAGDYKCLRCWTTKWNVEWQRGDSGPIFHLSFGGDEFQRLFVDQVNLSPKLSYIVENIKGEFTVAVKGNSAIRARTLCLLIVSS